MIATQGDRQLQCADATMVMHYIQLLAGRPAPASERTKVLTAVRARWISDPTATDAWLAQIGDGVKGLEGQRGIDAAEMRAALVFQTIEGHGLITPDDEPIWGTMKFRISVWARSTDRELAMTEADIEGWIYYASLCREAQGGGVLRLSVSDRNGLYNTLKDRWEHGTRADQTALVALGPFWSQVKLSWRSASYETQHAWISKAPLPPPMTATSLGYADIIFQGDLSRHVAVLHETLGPFYLRADSAAFPQ